MELTAHRRPPRRATRAIGHRPDPWPDRLTDGLTARPLTYGDEPAVTAVMAAQELADVGEVVIEEADIVGDWQRPSFDVGASTVGVFDGDRLVAYAEVRAPTAATPPSTPTTAAGASAPPSPLDAGHRPAPRRAGRRDAGARGLAGRPAAGGPGLPRALDQLGARAAPGAAIAERPLPAGYAVRAAEPERVRRRARR